MKITWAPLPGCGRGCACRSIARPSAPALLKRKLAEFGLDEEVPIVIKPLGSRFSVGNFDLEFIAVTHSIPEPGALAIRTPVRAPSCIPATGRSTARPTIPPDIDEARLRQIGEEGVAAFVCDSTNVLRAGHSPSEADVAATLDRLVARRPRPCRDHHLRLACRAHRLGDQGGAQWPDAKS